MLEAWCGGRLARAMPLVAAALSVSALTCAQEDKPVLTLHAYADLMQVPALVLDSRLRPMQHPIDAGQFVVSLDSGKRFSPSNVRLEGDDPLELAIVLDVSGTQKDLVKSLPGVGAEFAATLHPQDHLSLYALACGQLLTTGERIKPDPKVVESALLGLVESPEVAKRLNGTPCENNLQLWSGMVDVVRHLHGTAGRRSMLVVSGGQDEGSQITWADLHDVAGTEGVALFGMNDGKEMAARQLKAAKHHHIALDPFQDLCASTGGIVLRASPSTAGKGLAEWVTLLRGRYVIEFPRPQQMREGVHSIAISIEGEPDAVVTEAGVQVRLPNAAEMADPDRVHSDAGANIPIGDKRQLSDKH